MSSNPILMVLQWVAFGLLGLGFVYLIFGIGKLFWEEISELIRLKSHRK